MEAASSLFVYDQLIIANREQMETSMAMDQLHVMLHQESAVYSDCVNYLSKEDGISFTSEGAETTTGIGKILRQKICEWGFDVVDHFGYSREAAILATCYLDRFASYSYQRGAPLSRKNFQLAAVASLLLAMKIDRGSSRTSLEMTPQISISTFVALGRGRHSFQDIEQMEREILSALQWKMNPPTAVQFVYHLMQLHPPGEKISAAAHNAYLLIFETAKYLSELSVCVSELAIDHKPSTIAFASLQNAINSTDTSPLPQDFRTTFMANIASAMNLHKESKEIDEVRKILKIICPKISEESFNSPQRDGNQLHHRPIQRDDNLSENRQDSPVCISGTSSHRKECHP